MKKFAIYSLWVIALLLILVLSGIMRYQWEKFKFDWFYEQKTTSK